MHGGLAAAELARDSGYTFKNVLMVSPYWSDEKRITDAVEEAKKRGIKFYASYSQNEGDWTHPGDTSTTINFVRDKLAGLLSADPWHLPAVFGHDSAVWDVATFDEDKNGRADIWETILGENSEVMQDTDTSTNEDGEVDPVTEFADNLLLELIAREKNCLFPYSDIKKVCEIAMRNGIQSKGEQTAEEFIREIAEQFNIPITDSLEPTKSLEEGDEQTKDTGKTLADDEKYSDMLRDFAYKPHYNQKDYADPKEHQFGSSTISVSGCGISCIADYLTEKGLDITPIELAEIANKIHNFNSSRGAGSELMEALLADCGVDYDRSYWGDAWAPDKDGKRKALEALKEGKEVIVKQVHGGLFTDSGHYIRLTGITEDGKVIVYDPFGFAIQGGEQIGNWIDPDLRLKEGFREGFDPKDIWEHADDCFILEGPTKTASEIMEIIESTEDSE